MKFFNIAAVATLVSLTGLIPYSPAQATVVIDGQYDSAYGVRTSQVQYNPAAPSSNFQAPTNMSNSTGYDIFLTSDASFVYFLARANDQVPASLQFANLYFDLDPKNGNGSDVGFEVTNDRAFAFGTGGQPYSGPLGLMFAKSADNKGIEVALPNYLFTKAIPGLAYEYGANQQFASIGSQVVLQLSQTFGYSVAGGAGYGPDRLGRVTIGGAGAVPAVPESATWMMMLAGFGLIGNAMRVRTRRNASAAMA